jgi:hypothetical protein
MHTTLVLDVESSDDSTLTVEMTLDYQVEAADPGDWWNPPSGGQVYDLEITVDGVTDSAGDAVTLPPGGWRAVLVTLERDHAEALDEACLDDYHSGC